MKGFAKMDPEMRRQIASKGGKAVPSELRTFSRSPELASEAGKKGAEAKVRNMAEKKSESA